MARHLLALVAGQGLAHGLGDHWDDPALSSRRAQAARVSTARHREERIRAALKQLPQVQAAKRRNGDKPWSAWSIMLAGSPIAGAVRQRDGGLRGGAGSTQY